MATAIVCAYSPVGREALAGLLEAGIKVLALYTYPQSEDESWFIPPADLAKEAGIPIHMEPRFNEDHVFEAIQNSRPDFLFSFYFREMIQERFLRVPRLGAYNLHGSLLPKYRGRAPINWVLVKGEAETGVTLHAMTPKPDDGHIVGQCKLPIDWDETALSLTLKAAAAGRPLVREAVLKLLDGTCDFIDQRTLGTSTYFGGRKPEDSRIHCQMTSQEAFNQIRAVADPWPNAFIQTEKGTIKIGWALPSQSPCPMGSFRTDHTGTLLGFQDGALRLQRVKRGQTATERPNEIAQWLRELDIPESGE